MFQRVRTCNNHYSICDELHLNEISEAVYFDHRTSGRKICHFQLGNVLTGLHEAMEKILRAAAGVKN